MLPTLLKLVVLRRDFLLKRGLDIIFDGDIVPKTTISYLRNDITFLSYEENKHLENVLKYHQQTFEKSNGLCTRAEHLIRIQHDKPITQRYMTTNPCVGIVLMDGY